MILYILKYEDLKNVLNVLKFLIFPHFLQKSKFSLFLTNISEGSSTIRKYKICDQYLSKRSRKFWTFIKSSTGDINFWAPHMLPDTFLPADSDFWVLWSEV